MQKRRKYSQEYKQEAVQLVQQSNIPLVQAAANLGINPNTPGVTGTCLTGEFALLYGVSYCKISIRNRLNSCKFNFV
jgi:hypothetical protein